MHRCFEIRAENEDAEQHPINNRPEKRIHDIVASNARVFFKTERIKCASYEDAIVVVTSSTKKIKNRRHMLQNGLPMRRWPRRVPLDKRQEVASTVSIQTFQAILRLGPQSCARQWGSGFRYCHQRRSWHRTSWQPCYLPP